ncbi:MULTISPECIES: SAF domain-containing protein [Protofrankia]|uniref:Flagellar basal body P-ring biosynthesis protein FlgA n=1 Tax=Protofrankia coriariae TaxID=1562887 RepID=A0ABR5F5S7_9ACTN|nr:MULTISPECIES: SAF domain-containing protein [Protofrankia]KLL12030.1 flagellar basal body P-ring biosynthesis protein FlgA [Protofrankia coriariae]ONH35317.1 flagellar biosynthesis protein FlgA [Protofrankia sp. BMG5.30]
MTDLTPAVAVSEKPAAPPSPPTAPSPPARRLTPPRWRDSRLLVGVLLVLVSVVVGARLFATADRSQNWVVAAADLPAGHVVVAADLTTASAHLRSTTAARYFPGERRSELVGATLARPVSAGELLSGADFVLDDVRPTRLVSIVVKDGRAPALTPGDHVDIFVLQRSGPAGVGAAGAGTGTGVGAPGASAAQATGQVPVAQSGSAGTEVLVLHDVEFIARTTLAAGSYALTLRVPVELAINAVAASQSERVDVVKLERGSRGEVGGPGPSAVPGFGQ